MNFKKEQLEKLIFSGVSYEELGRRYGCSGSNIKKVALKLGIDLPKRRKINPKETFKKEKIIKYCLYCGEEIPNRNTYCDNSCKNEYYYLNWVKKWKQGIENGISGEYGISRYLKKFLFRKYDNKCSKCKWSEVNSTSGTIPLEIEHIDGNFQNNCEENLTLLCPNCHSLTPTYKGANRGNGRKERQKYT